MTSQLELFEDHLPFTPYCTDEKIAGLQIQQKAKAILKKYIQHNQPTKHRWLVYDCDYSGVLEHIASQFLPVPNIIVTNPASGHSHLFYGLKTPVCTSDNGRKKPLHLLSKIDFVLCQALQADQRYAGLISQNPLKVDHWQVQQINQNSWDLGDFLEYLELPEKLPRRSKVVGFGRNVTLFENARLYAYKQVIAFRLASTQEKFFDSVLSNCQSINQSFPVPLGFSEVKATAKSIARWTWKHYTGRVEDEVFSKIQARRGKLGGLKSGVSRVSKNEEKRLKARQMSLEGMTQTAIAKLLGVNQRTIGRWLKI